MTFGESEEKSQVISDKRPQQISRVLLSGEISISQRIIGTMDPQQFLPAVPGDVKFRVLIIGRANAGKTSILQRVCDTTESPHINRLNSQGERERVRSHS
jgi:hypothetical protein